MKENLKVMINSLKKKTLTIGLTRILATCGYRQVKQLQPIEHEKCSRSWEFYRLRRLMIFA